MFNRVKCFVRKHKLICAQTVTVNIDGTVDIDHNHVCARCLATKEFPTEQMDNELALMLQKLVAPQRVGVKLGEDPPTYIH